MGRRWPKNLQRHKRRHDDAQLPLINRLVEELPGRSQSADEARTAVTTKLRAFSLASIVSVALNYLVPAKQTNSEELKRVPWLILVLVKWAMQDESVGLQSGRSITLQELAGLANELWRVNEPFTEHFRLMLRRLMHPQLEFQRKQNWGFMRWPALYARLPVEHRCRQQFRNEFGMEPQTFLELTFVLSTPIVLGGHRIDPGWLERWRGEYGDAVDAFKAVFVRDMQSLRAEARASKKRPAKHEIHEFPWLKRFPLLELADGSLQGWHPIVFARGVEEAVHLRMTSELGGDYAIAFSKVFERYVVELCLDSGVKSFTEGELKAIAGESSSAVEAILEGEECNVLIEAKMALFDDDVLLTDDAEAIYRKTKQVRSGIGQAWEVGRIVRTHPDLVTCFDRKEDFLLLVTSRELLLGGGRALKDIYGDRFNPPTAEAEAHLPWDNIFVVGIEEFEHLMGAVRAANVDLSALLREAAAGNRHPATSRLMLSQFLEKKVERWTPPRLIEDAKAGALSKFTASLEGQGS